MINAGAVGQPRDGDPRVVYTTYDTDTRTVTRKRIPYDVEKAAKKIIDGGLPEILAIRLGEGK